MTYILDTNICIYIINHKPVSVLTKFQSIPLGEIGISIITFAELYYGAVKSTSPDKNIAALDRFVIPLEIFNFDYATFKETDNSLPLALANGKRKSITEGFSHMLQFNYLILLIINHIVLLLYLHFNK